MKNIGRGYDKRNKTEQKRKAIKEAPAKIRGYKTVSNTVKKLERILANLSQVSNTVKEKYVITHEPTNEKTGYPDDYSIEIKNNPDDPRYNETGVLTRIGLCASTNDDGDIDVDREVTYSNEDKLTTPGEITPSALIEEVTNIILGDLTLKEESILAQACNAGKGKPAEPEDPIV